MPPITLTPPTPGDEFASVNGLKSATRRSLDDSGREKGTAGRKVQKMLQDRVSKGQQRMSTISKKIGHGVSRRRHSLNLQRTTSLACASPSSTRISHIADFRSRSWTLLCTTLSSFVDSFAEA